MTIDTSRQHEINHRRVTYLIGDSASREITDEVPVLVAKCGGPVARHPEFAIDRERCGRFLISDHPDGWLRRGT